MESEVVVALIAACGSVIGTLLVTLSQRRKDNAEAAARRQERMDEINALRTELVEVKKKLDIHNGYAEKIGGIQKDIAVIKNDLSYLKRGK